MSEWAPKRFWKATEVASVDGGFSVLLDGRTVKTPAKAALVVPTEGLANAVAQEFAAQDEFIDPNTMPFTRTCNSAIDKVRVQHAEVADLLADYGDSDLLCYRADSPGELVTRQAEKWDPLLDWATQTLGARLEPRVGVMHSPQDAHAIALLREKVHALDAFQLAAFHDLVSMSGSLIIGFAAKSDAWPISELWDVSRLDELWQEEQWGVDEEAQDIVAIKKTAFEHAHAFMTMVR